MQDALPRSSVDVGPSAIRGCVGMTLPGRRCHESLIELALPQKALQVAVERKSSDSGPASPKRKIHEPLEE